MDRCCVHCQYYENATGECVITMEYRHEFESCNDFFMTIPVMGMEGDDEC